MNKGQKLLKKALIITSNLNIYNLLKIENNKKLVLVKISEKSMNLEMISPCIQQKNL